MKTTLLSFTCTLLLAVALPTSAQQDFSKVEIKATAVAGNIHMLEGSGGNIGVSVGPDGILIVDDQFAPLAAKIDAALEKLDKGSLKFVLNTHWHGDHTGGNAHFGRKGTIVASENVRKRLAAKEGTAKEALPVITFDKSLSVHFNGEEIKMTYFQPGHTDGDAMIHFTKSGVVHMGDQFVNRRFPFVDITSGGNAEGYIKNVALALTLTPDNAKVIPGHGALGNKADLKAFHEMLVETSAAVKKAVADGKPLAEIKATALPAKYKDWGDPSRWFEVLFNSLKK
jgi:cyclase